MSGSNGRGYPSRVQLLALRDGSSSTAWVATAVTAAPAPTSDPNAAGQPQPVGRASRNHPWTPKPSHKIYPRRSSGALSSAIGQRRCRSSRSSPVATRQETPVGRRLTAFRWQWADTAPAGCAWLQRGPSTDANDAPRKAEESCSTTDGPAARGRPLHGVDRNVCHDLMEWRSRGCRATIVCLAAR
jgi:hypothetical protein